jgi:hypothetical protein
MQVIPNKTTRLINRLLKRLAVIKAEQNLQTTPLLESKAARSTCTTDQLPKREKEDLQCERLQKRLMKRISERGNNLPTVVYVLFLAPLPLPKPKGGFMDPIYLRIVCVIVCEMIKTKKGFNLLKPFTSKCDPDRIQTYNLPDLSRDALFN